MKKKQKLPVIDKQIQYLVNTIESANACKTIDPYCKISSLIKKRGDSNVILSTNNDIYSKINYIQTYVTKRYYSDRCMIYLSLAHKFSYNDKEYYLYIAPYKHYIASVVAGQLSLYDNNLNKLNKKINSEDLMSAICKQIVYEFIEQTKNSGNRSVKKSIYNKYIEKFLNII